MQAGPAIVGHSTSRAGASPVLPSPQYLQDPAARRVAGDVLAGVEHAQRHAVEQDHQHADPLKPPAHTVKEATQPELHPPDELGFPGL